MAAGLFVLALAETLHRPDPDARVDEDHRHAGASPPPCTGGWPAQPGRDPIVHLPMLDVYGLERRPAYHESVYMVYSTLHWKPLVNGYAGIEPARYVELRDLARAFPSEELLDALRAIGVRYVVLHRGGYGPIPVGAHRGGASPVHERRLREWRPSARTRCSSCVRRRRRRAATSRV